MSIQVFPKLEILKELVMKMGKLKDPKLEMNLTVFGLLTKTIIKIYGCFKIKLSFLNIYIIQ